MKKVRQIKFPAPLFLLLLTLFHELMVHIWITNQIMLGRLLAVVLFGLGLGCLLGLITGLFPAKGQKWVAVLISVLLSVVYLGEYFTNDAYQCFMSPISIFNSAGGVATDFSSVVLTMLVLNLWRIGLMLLPTVLYAIFCRAEKTSWKIRTILAEGCVLLYLLGFCTVQWAGTDANVLAGAYNFDRAVRCFGLNPALAMELYRGGAEEEVQDFVIPETLPPEIAPTQPTTEPTVQQDPTGETEAPTEPPIVYGDNVLDLDFAALAEQESNSTVAAIHRYVASLTPTSQNEYTGLFKGKNLIFITAEAFSAEVIDPELTPTLYRLANEGIRFTDYYQPLWGGSTITGEYSNLTGLVAAGGTASMKEANQQDMFLLIGKQLKSLGYFSAAYHNHSYTYYERNKTHLAIGYDTFTGMGNGMEEGVTEQWPKSDLEMMQFTVEQYINQQPFSVYYMTISGHCLYSTIGNSMSRKNYDVVANMDASETIKAYYAAHLELEYALQYLVDALEDAGIADDTVIVLGTDHYPYGLENSTAWNNDKDYLSELYGYKYADHFQRDHNALIIWSGCLEDMDLTVDTPVYSLDILPTLSNLFGVAYDSRLLVGRDVFSEAEPLVLWTTHSWKTDKGQYDATTGVFTPVEGVEVSEEYVKYISSIVSNKIAYSQSVAYQNYFNYVVAAMKAE